MSLRKITGCLLLASPFVAIYFWAVFSLGYTWLGAALPFVFMLGLLLVISAGVYLLVSKG